MFAEKQTDIQGIPVLPSTIINLEINIDGKNILTPTYMIKSAQKAKKKTQTNKKIPFL